MNNPEREKPVGTFSEIMESAPDEMSASNPGVACTVQLFSDGNPIGWLGHNSSEWCIAVKKEDAVAIEAYTYKQTTYYRKAGDTSRYLSVSNGWHYVGFYGWMGATGWTLKGDRLISEYTQAALSYWSSDDNYLYANNSSGFKQLTVKFIC